MGWPGARRSLYLLNRGFWRFGQRMPVGTNIYERDWDALVVLDACRVDILREVADEYEFIDEVDSV